MMKYPTISRLSIEDRKQYKDSQKKQSLSSFDDVMQYVLQEYYLKDRRYRNKSSLQSMAYNLTPQFVNEINVFCVMYDAGLGELLESEKNPVADDIEKCKRQLLQIFAEPQVNNVLNIVLTARGNDKQTTVTQIKNIKYESEKSEHTRTVETEQKNHEKSTEQQGLNKYGVLSNNTGHNGTNKGRDTQITIEKEKNDKKRRNKVLLLAIAALVVICILIGVAVGNSSKQNNNTIGDKTVTSTQKATSAETQSSTEESKTSKNTERTTAKEKSTEADNAAKGPDGLKMPDKNSEPIYIYSWDDDLGTKLKYVREKFPEYSDLIKFVNLGVGATTAEYVDGVENAENTPSIIASDVDLTYYFTQSDATVSLSQIGLTEDMYKNAFPYTIEYGSVGGKLKAMSGQSTPGCFVYRTDIAEKVLGTSDPDEVQKYVKDWQTFMETAEKMKAAGYKMVSGGTDIHRPMLQSNRSKWVNGNTVSFDDSVPDCLELSNRLVYGGYTNDSGQFDDGWYSGMTGDVFGYFGSPWFIYGTLEDYPGSATYGKRNICQGPESYYWGGTYLTVTASCPNKELAALVLYTLCCDTDVMYKMQCDNADFVNNTVAIDRAISDGYGSTDILNGTNPLKEWKENALQINSGEPSEYDLAIFDTFQTASWDYNHGYISSADDAIEQIKSELRSSYSGLQVD